MAISEKLLDELLNDYKNPEDLLGKDGIMQELKKRLIERAMETELTHHLGHDRNAKSKNGNQRNGYSSKKIKSSDDEFEINIPREREGDFEPKIIPKHQRRFDGFDEKIISMYSLGMTTTDIQKHLFEMYNYEVSTGLISEVTNAVINDVHEWQTRPLEPVYPILYLDCIVVKVREDKRIKNKSVYLSLAVNMEGKKELLGMWIAGNEGAKFWLHVITELKNRGIEDIFIACVDGLKGFPDAIAAVFPQTQVQLCIVHMIRNSMKYVSYKDRKELAADLKQVYTSLNAEEAEDRLLEFAEKWDGKYPAVSKQWQSK